MDVKIDPAVMRDRFQLSGVFAVTPLGPGRCRREFSGEIKGLRCRCSAARSKNS